jgi:hypothetical protein
VGNRTPFVPNSLAQQFQDLAHRIPVAAANVDTTQQDDEFRHGGLIQDTSLLEVQNIRVGEQPGCTASVQEDNALVLVETTLAYVIDHSGQRLAAVYRVK